MKLQDLIPLNKATKASWMLKTKEEIKSWLDKRGAWREVAAINRDLTIDVYGSVGLPEESLVKNKIPVRFNKINGNFSCSLNKLESLIGSPRHVTGDFFCSGNKLKTFEGSPDFIGGDLTCHSNLFRSFEGFPKHVGGGCYAHSNPALTSLHNTHKDVKYIEGFLTIPKTVRSNIIGIMLIKGIKAVTLWANPRPIHPGLQPALDIINKHLKGERNIHDAQEELIEAGLGAYAKL